MLLVLASPFAGLRLGFPDRGNDAVDTTTRQAYDLVARGFGPGANGPLLLVAPLAGQADRDDVAALAVRLGEQPGVASVGEPAISPAGDAALLTVIPTTSPQDPADRGRWCDRLRADVLPGAGVPVSLGGATAAFMDQSRATADRLPLFIGGVVGLAFLLLLVSFRSVVVAVKAGIMNLLSIAAAYGVVAYLAEGGWAGQLVGIDTRDAGAAVHPRDHVRGPVRPLDGLRGVPALARAGGVPGPAATRARRSPRASPGRRG